MSTKKVSVYYLESVSYKKDFEILVRDVILKIKMGAFLSKPRLLPKCQSPFYLQPTLVHTYLIK